MFEQCAFTLHPFLLTFDLAGSGCEPINHDDVVSEVMRVIEDRIKPDWVIVFKGEKKIYFVAETKGEGQELRGSERLKIKCGTEHFKRFEEVVYKRISKVSELSSSDM